MIDLYLFKRGLPLFKPTENLFAQHTAKTSWQGGMQAHTVDLCSPHPPSSFAQIKTNSTFRYFYFLSFSVILVQQYNSSPLPFNLFPKYTKSQHFRGRNRCCNSSIVHSLIHTSVWSRITKAYAYSCYISVIVAWI